MSKPDRRLLIVDDDAGLRSQLKWAFDGFEVFEAADRKSALALVRRVSPAVVLLDLGLPPSVHDTSEGLRTLDDIRTEEPGAKVVVITGQDERSVAREVVSRGAYDFFAKPPNLEEVRMIVSRAFGLVELETENARLTVRTARHSIEGLIAQSEAMTVLCQKIERVAPTNVSVMLTGESGTGKEVLAKALHELGPRKDAPFVAINCAAIPSQLLESELFGFEKGAFTGAHRTTPGKVEQASGGTLFLDEIAELDPAMQSKLLRFIQERCFERVGGRKTIAVDVRVVSATNRNLTEGMRNGTFREDLFFRLSEINLTVPPLREREGDAILLARHFARVEARNLGIPPKKIGTRAQAAISHYPWPGNVRELQNRTRRALVLCERDILEPADFELPDAQGEALLPTLRQERHRVERELVQRTLINTNGKIAEAARLLGVSRPTLYELLHSLDIPIPSA